MQIKIDDNYYDVEIIKKNNRNTYIRVKNGKIVVTTNYLVSKRSIEKLINDNVSSIIKRAINQHNLLFFLSSIAKILIKSLCSLTA